MNAKTALDLFIYFSEKIESGDFNDESSLATLQAHKDAYEKLHLDLSKNENHLFEELGLATINDNSL
jgi:hypothetical protein